MKIITILGARPQFIKAGSVSREIMRKKQAGMDIQEVIVHTGQHYDVNMSDVFFDEMQIPKPSYYLGIGGKSHGAMTGQMIEKIEEVLIKEQPDWVMVYGDTNSTLAGAIAASKLNVKIAHVEAGLRSFNMQMPEEINRIVTDRISTMLFCPTLAAMKNLELEGLAEWQTGAQVIQSGDVMLDGVLFYKDFARQPDRIHTENDFILCTIHRAENTDNLERLARIVLALNEIARDKLVVIPLHPRTQKILQAGDFDIENLMVIEPVGYLNMVWLLDHCSLVITDSGGLQKEAFFFRKPCITLRDETEWVELVDAGYNYLVNVKKQSLTHKIESILKKQIDWSQSFYGTGNAAELIVDSLYVENISK